MVVGGLIGPSHAERGNEEFPVAHRTGSNPGKRLLVCSLAHFARCLPIRRQSDCSRLDGRCRINLLEEQTTELGSTNALGERTRRGRHRRSPDPDQDLFETDHRGRRSGRVAGAARRRGRLRVSGGREHALHQALTRYRDRIRTILPRHEQGGIFAAEGYARARASPACDGDFGPRGAQPGHRLG